MFSKRQNLSRSDKEAFTFLLSTLVKAIEQSTQSTESQNQVMLKISQRARYLLEDDLALSCFVQNKYYSIHNNSVDNLSEFKEFGDLCAKIINFDRELIIDKYRVQEFRFNAQSKKNQVIFANVTRLTLILLLASFVLGYIAFVIALSSLGSTPSLVLACRLFFDITGYGMVGAAGLFFLSFPAIVIVDKSSKFYYDSKVKKIEGAFVKEQISDRYEDFNSEYFKNNHDDICKNYNNLISQNTTIEPIPV